MKTTQFFNGFGCDKHTTVIVELPYGCQQAFFFFGDLEFFTAWGSRKSLFSRQKVHGGYRPSIDTVVLPLKKQFKNPAEYYSTAFHELTHSTGHESRLNRLTQFAAFGSEVYRKEELVAEIGASVLMQQFRLETPESFRNNAAYIQNWLSVLKNDKRMIVSAAGRAEKATNLILGI